MGGLIRAERDSRSAACVSYGWHTVVSVTLLLVLTATEAIGQSELQGRVLADGSRRPVANAEVAVPRLELRTVTDSLGRYRLSNVPPGAHLVVTRAVGYRPDSALTTFDGDETLISDVILLSPMTALPTVAVREVASP